MTEHYQHESISDQMRRSREELNTLTFARDYGFDATRYVMDVLGRPQFFQAVALQRAQIRVNGGFVMDEKGNEHRTIKIDLAQIGLSAADQRKVLTLHAGEAKKTPATVSVAELAEIAANASAEAGQQADAAGIPVAGLTAGSTFAADVTAARGGPTARTGTYVSPRGPGAAAEI